MDQDQSDRGARHGAKRTGRRAAYEIFAGTRGVRMEAYRPDERYFARCAQAVRNERTIRRLSAQSAGPVSPRGKSMSELAHDQSALVVEGMSKRFRTKRSDVQALEDVNLRVAQGEFVCLVGTSGCGKSTLLDIMAGLTKPDRGRVLA